MAKAEPVQAAARILIVEDERIVARDLAETLAELGYDVVGTVATGEDAVARARSDQPSAILMDIRLAGAIDGIEAATQIRAERDIPIIYLTAHADEETLQRAKGTEPLGYLVKPFRGPELRCALEIALHKHEIDTRLRGRSAWLASTLQSIGEAEPDNPVSAALADWAGDPALAWTLGEIAGTPVSMPATLATGPASPAAIARHNEDVERRVVERTKLLEAANKELEDFTFSVAHDLRAPLRGIDGFSQALIEDHAANLGAAGLAHLQRVRAAAGRMGTLIEDLLRMARSASTALARQSIDLSTLAWNIGEGLRGPARTRDVALEVRPGMIVDGDPGLVRLVLENLIGNAWKYTSRTEVARIEVGELERDGERVFFVRDNGAGFDSAGAARLFETFQRFHTGAEFEGNGLGLAIAQRIISRHGGRIWAESQVGRGATFYFTL